MLKFWWMFKPFFALTALTTCLVTIPAQPAHAELRQEAASYRRQGFEAQQRGDRDAALSYYQKAVALDPTFATPHNDLGVLYEEVGRMEEAERSYLQALSLDPAYIDPHANLAMLYERLGQQEKAVYHWMKRYQLGLPGDPWTLQAEARLVALGVVNPASLKGKRNARTQQLQEAFHAHAQSVEEFRDLTEQHGNWP